MPPAQEKLHPYCAHDRQAHKLVHEFDLPAQDPAQGCPENQQHGSERLRRPVEVERPWVRGPQEEGAERVEK